MKRVSASPSPSDNIDSTESCAIKRHKNFEDLIDLLECSVYQKSLRPDDSFNACENSHLLCTDCEIELKKTNGLYAWKCPTCRIPWRPCKTLFIKAYLEVAFDSKLLSCRNVLCPMTGQWKDLIGHSHFCFYQNVWCPGRLTNNCAFKGSINQLADHIKSKKCSRLFIDHHRRSDDEANQVNFRGSLNNRTGISLFQERNSLALKQIVLLSSKFYKFFPFLQVERSAHGRWIFSMWSCLSAEVLEECYALISVRAMDGKIFSSKVKILSLMSTSKNSGLSAGNCSILFDEQIRIDLKQAKIFYFKIGVITSEKFRKKLNGQEDPHPEFLNTIASNPCENCIVINKRHVQVVNDLSTGDPTVMTADYGRVPPMMIEDNGELNMTVNQSPQSPAEIDENLNNDLNDTVEVIQCLYDPQQRSP